MSARDLDDLFNRPTMAKDPEVTPKDVLAALRFSAPREVKTKLGARMVSSAEPTKEFRALYNERTQWLRQQGYTLNFNTYLGKEMVSLWQIMPEAVVIERNQAIQMSRATDADINVPVPDGLSYLGYQKAGIAFGLTRPAVLIGDEMGLGKTIQAIGMLNGDTAIKRVLVICPASLKLNWKRELERWLVRRRPVIIADGKLFMAVADGITIINYDILHKHIEEIRCNVWDMVVADECHLLKNRKARRSAMVFGVKVSKKEKKAGMADVPGIMAKKKVFLSGTPIANKPAELYPIINYLDAHSWPSFWSYAKRYCGGHDDGFGYNTDGASHLDELQEKLRSTIMIRRLKRDVLKDLPPKTRQIIEFTPTGEARHLIVAEKATYDSREAEMEAAAVALELAKADDNEDAYKAAVGKLKEVTDAIFGAMSTIRRETSLAKVKMKEIMEHLDSAVEDSGKVVIFAHHKETIALLAEHFGSACVVLVGDTPMQDRQNAVDDFQKKKEVTVFIGGIIPAGVGITLTASAHVIFIEADWVPGNVSQAEDRCHRIGQKDNVLVQHLVLEGSIDATILRRIISKQEIIDKALDKTVAPEDDAPLSRAASAGVSRDKLAAEAKGMTEEQVRSVHDALRKLSMVCNGAKDWDGAGFNKLDTRIGKDLAARPYLSPKQAALGRKIARKYRGQLGEEMTAAMGELS